jgi:hypothetical protein
MDAMKSRLLLAGTLLGLIYGTFAAAMFWKSIGLLGVSSIALVPAALAFLPFVFADERQVALFRKVIFGPWVTMTGMLLVCVAFDLWPFVSIFAVATLPMMVIGLVWWACGALRIWRLSRQRRALVAMALMVLPFVASAYDTPDAELGMFVVERSATVRAPAPLVERLKYEDITAETRWTQGLRPFGVGMFFMDPEVRMDGASQRLPHTKVTVTGCSAGAPLSASARRWLTPLIALTEDRLLANLTRRAELSALAATAPAPSAGSSAGSSGS